MPNPTAISFPPVAAVPADATPVLSAAATAAIDSKTAAPASGKCWYFGGMIVTYSVTPAATSLVEVYVRNGADSADDYLLFKTWITVGGPAPVYLPVALRAPADRKLRFAAALDATAAIALVPLLWEGLP